MSGSRWERGATRAGAGLALLLMLSLPLSIVPAIWTADVRWFLSGVVLGLIGFGFGVVIRDVGQKANR